MPCPTTSVNCSPRRRLWPRSLTVRSPSRGRAATAQPSRHHRAPFATTSRALNTEPAAQTTPHAPIEMPRSPASTTPFRRRAVRSRGCRDPAHRPPRSLDRGRHVTAQGCYGAGHDRARPSLGRPGVLFYPRAAGVAGDRVTVTRAKPRLHLPASHGNVPTRTYYSVGCMTTNKRDRRSDQSQRIGLRRSDHCGLSQPSGGG
jgi:hypothetical protein